MNEKNYWEEKINEIKTIAKKNKKEAIRLLELELNMPYIPQKYESVFLELKNLLSSSKKIHFPKMTDEEIYKNLDSNDNLKIVKAILELSSLNVRKYLKFIKKWIESKHMTKFATLRSFMYEILVEQEVDISLVIDGKKINPFYNKAIIQKKDNIQILNYIQKYFFKEPNVLRIAESEFKNYLYKIFPKEILNPKIFAQDFVKVISSLFNKNIDLNRNQMKIFQEISKTES